MIEFGWIPRRADRRVAPLVIWGINYCELPYKVYFLVSPYLKESPLRETVHKSLVALNGYQEVAEQGQADLVVTLLRPLRCDGKPHFTTNPEGRKNTLPDEAHDAPAEVWILTPAERLLDDAFCASLDNEPKGLQRLQTNLTRYRQLRDLRGLVQESGKVGEIEIGLITYERCDAPDCKPIKGGESYRYRRLPDALSLSALEKKEKKWRVGDAISFEIHNAGRRERYVYLFNVSPEGQIQVIFPDDETPASARFKSDDRLSMDKPNFSGLRFSKDGAEEILVLVTEQAINPFRLEQPSYERSKTRETSLRGYLNPLDKLLSDTLTGTRADKVNVSSGSWGSEWVRIEVQPAGP
ncbi:hypothetical protein CCP4SC76_6090007 [Gammaproteobacteria bacterium]